MSKTSTRTIYQWRCARLCGKVHRMMTSADRTFSALLTLYEGNPLVADEFPSKRPVTLSFDVFFDLRLDKRLSKQSRHRWFETPSRLLLHHCNVKKCAHGSRFVVLCYGISFMVTSLTLGQSCDFPVSVKQPWRIWVNVSTGCNRNWWYNQNKTKQNKTISMFYGVYCISIPQSCITPLIL